MQVKVDIDKIGIIQSEQINSGEYNTREIQFNIAENMQGLILKALFTKDYKTYEVEIENDSCMIPWEALECNGNCELGVYAYSVNGDVLEIRYSPEPTKFYINAGSYRTDVANGEEPTPTRSEVLEGKIKELDNKKVDKKEGYGLSQNDFTNELKTKLDNAGKQEDIDRLKTENQEQEEQINYLDKTLTRAEATGENINVKDSAEYPISNISIDTNIKQDSREGYNLLEPIMKSATSNGVTCTNNGDGTFTLNGTSSAKATFRLDQNNLGGTNNLKNYDDGDYEISLGITNSNLRLLVMQNNTWKSLLILPANTEKYHATMTNATDCFIYLDVYKDATFNNVVVKPMLRKYNNDVKPYEQYGSMPSIAYPSEIKTPVGKQELYFGNKNILPITLKSSIKSNVQIINNNDGSITLNGTPSGGVQINLTDEMINYENDYYTISYEVISGKTTINENVPVGARFVFIVYPYTGKSFVFNTNTSKTIQLDNTSGKPYIWLGFDANYGGAYATFDNFRIKIQIEKRETGTEIVKHQHQTQDIDVGELLGPIVDKEDGSYFENRYGKYIFTGKETINKNSADTTNYLYYSNFLKDVADLTNIELYCSHLKENTLANLNNNNEEGICLHSNGTLYFNIHSILVENTAIKFKAFLKELYDAGTPLYMIYKLATPTYTKLTDEQQAQWNKIKKMHTYEGVTNIYTINENGISPVINMKYVKSPKVVEENLQAQIDKLKNSIISMGGNL